MKLISYLLIVLLFMGPSVLTILGWPVEKSTSFFTSLYPSFYILLIVLLFASPKVRRQYKSAAILVVAPILYWMIAKFFFGISLSKGVTFNSLSLPAMYAIFFTSSLISISSNEVRKTILLLYCVNSLIAIYERLSLQSLFPTTIGYLSGALDQSGFDAQIFRSSSLIGHHLSNALITSIIMAYVLVSDIKIAMKFSLYGLGFIALLCFNARASIIISVLFFSVFLLKYIFVINKKAYHRGWVIIIGIFFFYILTFLFGQGFGARLMNTDFTAADSSILARISIWNIFETYDLSQFLFGMEGERVYAMALFVTGLAHVENWLILMIMNDGLILIALCVLLFIPLFKKTYSYYSNFDWWFCFCVFIILASTNNSLACGVPAIAMYFACAYGFKQKAA